MPRLRWPTYCGLRLSSASWRRKAQATGRFQAAAKRCSCCAAAALQPLPPATTSGWRAACSACAICASAASEGGTACNAHAAKAMVCVVSTSMSSGSDTTTGPGRPETAVWKARATISAMREASVTSTTHLARPPNMAW